MQIVYRKLKNFIYIKGFLVIDLWFHLSKKRKFKLFVLAILILSSGISEIFNLAMVVPFLAVLNDPQSLLEIPLINKFILNFGLTDNYSLTVFTSFTFILAIIFSSGLRVLNLKVNAITAAEIGSDISDKVFLKTLYQPYIYHTRNNSSDIISTVSTNIDCTVYSINALLQLTSSLVVCFSLLLTLFVINKSIALSSLLIIGTSYLFIGWISKKRLRKIGQLNAIALVDLVKLVQEGIGNIRDIILNKSQKHYLDIYHEIDRPRRKRIAQSIFITSYPKSSIEAIGLIFISSIAIALTFQGKNSATIITTLGTLAIASQRIIQSLQQVFVSWTALEVYRANVQKVLDKLNLPLPEKYNNEVETPLKFKKQIYLKNISFKYYDSSVNVFEDINLSIKKGERLGIIGETGGGKSTFIDIIMGLLEPTNGSIEVDGKTIRNNNFKELNRWRSCISHVPQNIYLSDRSISENIAFGIKKREINMKLVRHVAKLACIDEFIETNKYKYETLVGERGVRLSGGQRQRIGIARALYKKNPILILDEATSALDDKTEKRIVNSINNFDKNLTIIMIAHRLSTLEVCNNIIKIENGFIKVIDKSEII